MSFSRFNKSNSSFQRFSQPTDPYDTTSIDNQIKNASTRIQDAGFQPDNADKRNWFERLTNLPQKQNFFFDTLELLGRPGQSVMNAIHKKNTSMSLGEALKRGISGDDKIRGSELLQGTNMNAAAKAVVGTGLEIALDPLTYVPGGILAKGVTIPGKAAGRAVSGAYKATENAIPSFARFSENTLRPAAENVKDGLGYMFNSEYKIKDTLDGGKSDFLKNLNQQTDNSRRYMQEETLGNLGRVARDAGGIDTGADVGRIMEKPLRQFEDVKGYEFPDGLRRTENKQDLFAEISKNRGSIKNIGKDIRATSGQYDQAIGQFGNALDQTDSQLRKLFAGLEREAGKNLDSTTRGNLREASLELKRLDSQINNFDNAQESVLRHFKKQVKDNHESNFELLKRIKDVAPNGVKGVARQEMPNGLLIRKEGKAIDEVANELGYQYADDLVQELKRLNNVPRKLDEETVTRFAQQEMQRTGSLERLQDTFKGLQTAKSTIQNSIKDIAKQAPKTRAAKAAAQAFAKLSDHPEYVRLTQQRDALKQQFDALKTESKSTRQGKVDQIKQHEADIQTLHEAAKNPVIVQKEIPRPPRESSADPKIQKAAQKLVKSNAVIREFAEQNGIGIPELEGYMTHVWSQEERARRTRVSAVDRGSRGTGNPNKSILKNRELTGSAEDINDKLGRKFFEPNAFYASAIGQKRLVDYVHAVKFRREVLSNPEFANKFVKGMTVPKGAEVIDTNNYKFLKDSGDVLDGMGLADEVGGQYIVTKQAKLLLDRYQRINTDEGTKAFLKAFDTIQSFWKRGALFSLGYHVRNQAGAMFNNYVGGMNPVDIAKYTQDGFKEVARAIGGKESALFTEYRKQGLSSTALSQVEFARYGEEPEKAIEKTVKNLSKDTKGQVTQRLNPVNAFKTSQEVGNFFDQGNRFALYKWAREKLNLSPEKAAEKVREVQFDYTKLTPFEQNVVARVVPFYRWMRNNIPFQVRQFINDPRKYEYLNKARLNAQQAVGLDDENIPDYMKESFSMPISGEGGKGKMLGLNLPLGDLTKLSRPGKTLIDSVSPLLKTPAELALNFNTFRGKPIQQFSGQQKQYEVPGIGEFGVPIKGAYAFEQATGQIGRGLSGLMQKPENVDQDVKNRLPTLGISSLTKDFDAEKYAYYAKLNELKQLQDLILFIEQQTGDKPRTVREIAKGR
ncbi:hypothetical protein SD71_10815 [Cohnella kolymensis]|uniref:Large polyvalent protein associated domain-containing protein n=1 Tax=Cohnella kolymensis TaxID=1590652 RepID=A0ABR5A4A0_9BACL|nr:hypothetical protein [Cohnella kolymensis]KIL35874.1 hypothetical protein SD71_10815 [Cohnella kolymensis]